MSGSSIGRAIALEPTTVFGLVRTFSFQAHAAPGEEGSAPRVEPDGSY